MMYVPAASPPARSGSTSPSAAPADMATYIYCGRPGVRWPDEKPNRLAFQPIQGKEAQSVFTFVPLPMQLHPPPPPRRTVLDFLCIRPRGSPFQQKLPTPPPAVVAAPLQLLQLLLLLNGSSAPIVPSLPFFFSLDVDCYSGYLVH